MSIYAPGTKGTPWNWASRRDAILSRTDNVLRWAQPLGFVAPYQGPEEQGTTIINDMNRALAERAELDHLIATQHLDIAPEWRLLQENGIDAASIDGSSSSNDDSDADTTIAIAGDPLMSSSEPTIYLLPDRRELWWMEEDEYRWKCGPIVRAEYYKRDDGKRGLRFIGRTGLTTERETEWLQAISAYDEQHGLKPDVDAIADARADLHARSQHYGPGWLKTLVVGEEALSIEQQAALDKAMDILDGDAERNAFKDEDALLAYTASRPHGYAGEGDLGTQVWDGYDQNSFWQQHDIDPDLLQQSELR